MNIGRRQFGGCILGGIATRAWAAPPRPKLTLVIVLEQFRPDYLDAVSLPQLSPGGFRRLLEHGAYFPDCRNLASTFSSSSLATLSTGAWPAEHGIVADHWYDRATRARIRASDEELIATTLPFQTAVETRNRVWIVGIDPGDTRIFTGTQDAGAYWFDERGQVAARSDPPDWLAGFNAQHSPDALRNRKWTALGSKPDSAALRTLTFDEQHPEQFIELYKASPFAQETQFDFVGELIAREKLGQGSGLDFVCLLAGSMANLGYDVGGRSPLMPQMMLHLDRRLDALQGQLIKTFGENGFTVAVVGAHGAPPEPLPETRARMAINGEDLAQAISKSLAAHGLGRVQRYVYPFLYLDTSGFRDPEPIRMAAARAALEHPAVAAYYTAGGACSTNDEWQRRFRNSFHANRSGDVMLSYRPEYVEDFARGRGVSYGSLYNYDVRVPLWLSGPQFRTGVYDGPVELIDVAPTLARTMGVAPPSSSSGRVLAEALL